MPQRPNNQRRVAMKSPVAVIVLFSAALLFFSIDVASARQSKKCLSKYIGDGDCDIENNRAECSFDGGDCCFCSCQSGPDWECGASGFHCLDPAASCLDDDGADDDDYYSSPADACITSFVGDGECDAQNNVEACDYDGGDCCECTCEGEKYPCGGGVLGFQCKDPDGMHCPLPTPSPTPNPSPSPITMPSPTATVVRPSRYCHYSPLSLAAWWTPPCWFSW